MRLLRRLLRISKPCPHLSVDELGRCEQCSAWLPYYDPPERLPAKRASELSILAIEEEPKGKMEEQNGRHPEETVNVLGCHSVLRG